MNNGHTGLGFRRSLEVYEVAKIANQPDDCAKAFEQWINASEGYGLAFAKECWNAAWKEALATKRESVIGELVAMDFEPEQPEITFQVPKDSRWFAGKYAITEIEGGK